jgi:hypothetical protein
MELSGRFLDSAHCVRKSDCTAHAMCSVLEVFYQMAHYILVRWYFWEYMWCTLCACDTGFTEDIHMYTETTSCMRDVERPAC